MTGWVSLLLRLDVVLPRSKGHPGAYASRLSFVAATRLWKHRKAIVGQGSDRQRTDRVEEP